MNSCAHNSKIGDNYGMTCLDCGKPLEGYGYFAKGSRVCIHRFLPVTPEPEVQRECVYCQMPEPLGEQAGA